MTGRRREGNAGAQWLAFAALLIVACDAAPPAPELTPTRGTILISIDTLRADHLGCYGYGRDTSPFLDSLAERGTLFENAVVQLPGTLPSHMSIFTGLYPAEHGVYPPAGVLAAEIETLPEVFQRHGFATAGFSAGGYTDGSYGFARGFDRWSDDPGADGVGMFDRGIGFLSELEAEQPFFLFLHTYAVHDPYDPPEPYRSQFWHRDPAATFEPTGPNLVAVNRGTRQVTPEAMEYFVALYDGGIRHVDEVLRRFFADLDRLGLRDQVTVIVTSDHGEEFLDHGYLVHEQVYDETLRVPLIVLHPAAGRGRRIADLVQSIDLAPTLYQLAAIPPPDRLSGRSLVPFLTAGGTAGAGAGGEAYAESHDGSARALYRRTAAGDLHHLLRVDLGGEDGLWVTGRGLSFDAFGDQVRFEARAFERPRQVAVAVDGEPQAPVELGTAWQPVRLPLAGSGERTVTLTPASCDSPASLSQSNDRRCLAFRLRGISLKRLELYDLASDRPGSRDLSGEQAAVTRDLHRRLEAYDWPPPPAAQGELDPELAERLRALGYLQ